jgi:hypothetical protein
MASIRVNSRQNYGASPRFCAGGAAHTEVWAVRQCALRAQLKTLELGDMKLGDLAPLHTDGPIYTEMEDQMRYRIVVWSAIAWIAICLAPYFYALNDLITWK